MRNPTCLLVASLSFTLSAYGQSQIVYTLETGGDDHVNQWEANSNPMPAFTRGSPTGGTTVLMGGDLTWAVRVTVGNTSGHSAPTVDGPGHNQLALGAACLAFDLAVLQADNATPVTFGAAPITCDTGTPGVFGAKGCKPSSAGFWSQINDGDADGIRGAARGIDLWANAAFAIGIYNSEIPPFQERSLIDPAAALVGGADPGTGGPNFDYGWYPTAKGHGGIDIAGTHTIDTTSTAVNSTVLNGRLVGFGAGYKSYDYTNYRPGVGIQLITFSDYGFGAGNEGDPLNPVHPERPLFEGQLNTSNLAPGTYYLKLTPSQNGNNILHGSVAWDSLTPNYGGFGTFAAKANQVGVAVNGTLQPSGSIPFVVASCDLCAGYVVARKIFYNNSYYDGNKIGIDTGISPTNNHDDDFDAVDTSKRPLMVDDGTATFANWTGFVQGINGLIYDIEYPTRTPVASDFTFKNIGKAGTAPGTIVTPSGFATYTVSTMPQVTRCVITFASTGGPVPGGSVRNTWLQVTIGMGFGGSAPETHWWGNVVGDDGTFSGPSILVNATDEVDARNHPRGIANRAPVDCPWDYNKDGLVNSTDEVIARNNPASLLTAMKRIVR
jgi:hypothetical protein